MIEIVKDQLGNVYAKGGTLGGSFLMALGIICFIIGGLAMIGGVIGAGLVSGIIGTIFVYGGSHYTNNARKRKLREAGYMI